MSQPIKGLGSHLCFPNGPKNTIFLEDVEILLFVKFRWIQFCVFREKIGENVSANQRQVWPFSVSDRPERHKLGRWRWDLASCQVSLNFVKRFQRNVKNVSANQRQGRPSWFSTRPQNTNLIEDVEILLPVKFRWIQFSSFRGKNRKYISKSEARLVILVFRSAGKKQTW